MKYFALERQGSNSYLLCQRDRELERLWFGHVQRRDKDDATRKILQMTVDGKRIRGRPELRWRDLVKEDRPKTRSRLRWQRTENTVIS